MKKTALLLKGNINYDNRVQKEINTLVSLGHEVTLIVWNWETVDYKHKDLNIIEVNLSNHKIPHSGGLITFLKIVIFWFIAARIIREGDYNFIHCNDLDTLGIMYFLGRKYQEKIIYDAHELYPEHFTSSSIRYKVWDWIERQLVRKISKVIVPDYQRAKYMKDKYFLPRLPYVINNFPQYSEVAARDIKNELNVPEGKKLICYHGVISNDRYVEELIESLVYLPKDYVLVFIGYAYNSYLEELKEIIHNKGLGDRIVFYGKVPASDILSTIAQFDVGVALYKNTGINNYLCAPNKIFDYLMAGVRVVVNDYPSLAILRDYRFAHLLKETHPRSIAEAIQGLIRDHATISEEIKHQFSWEKFRNLFEEIYN